MRFSLPVAGLATLTCVTGVAALAASGPADAGARGSGTDGALIHAVAPPPAHTGGFGEPTCQICHEGDALNAYGGSIRLEGLPDAYEPGRTYPLTVMLAMEQTSRAGFQVAARFAQGEAVGRPAGELSAISPGVTTTLGENGVPYLHQTEEGSVPASSEGTSWSLEWIAPRSGAPVVFHLAGNSANGDNSPLLDLVFTAEATVHAATQR